MENAEQEDLEDERMKVYTKGVEGIRMSRKLLLILIIWIMSGNR